MTLTGVCTTVCVVAVWIGSMALMRLRRTRGPAGGVIVLEAR
jgi:hypothetical protein